MCRLHLCAGEENIGTVLHWKLHDEGRKLGVLGLSPTWMTCALSAVMSCWNCGCPKLVFLLLL